VKSDGKYERHLTVERKSIVLLEGSQVSAARPFYKRGGKLKTLEWSDRGYEILVS
jgi:hypothetical protein